MNKIWSPNINSLIETALKEDICTGDITTEMLIDNNSVGEAVAIAKEDFIVCGLDIFGLVFQKLDPLLQVFYKFYDGDYVKKGKDVVIVRGRLKPILTAERVALNFLQHLSGIATLTNKFVASIPDGSNTKIVDTRKTIPGLRELEKYAVRSGGGFNHRANLSGGILIKDNHIASCGCVTKAIEYAKKSSGVSLRIEVEVETLEQVEQAVKAEAEIIMLDNMDIETIKKALKIINGKALVEVSGGITIEKIKELASLGIDFISSGSLTNSAKSVDISLEIKNTYE